MPWNAASRVAHVPAGPQLTAHAGQLLAYISDQLRLTLPMQREQVVHRVLLFAIVCIGAWVRFWGLGNVGLHGDEETMAMATMHIVREGIPVLPSGMLYPRGLTELYLMAAAVQLFGESEWAFRLPSALCGVLVIWLAWLAGRRFLQPVWNLAFAASVALLPSMIIYSQTARMYIFLLAAVAACMVCVFAWERSGRLGWLIGAVASLIVGIDLHALAVTCVLLFLMPGFLRGDLRRILYGSVAAVVVMLAYLIITRWVDGQYPVPPPEYAADLGAPLWDRSRAPQSFAMTFEIALWTAGLAMAFFAYHLSRVIPHRPGKIGVMALLLAGLVAQLLLFYHITVLSFVAGIVLARRTGGPRVWRRLWIFALGSGLLALIHVSLLISTPGSLAKVIGALVGQPSIWPYVRLADFTAFGAILTAAALAWGFWRFAKHRRLPDYWLFAVLTVWIPIFMIGFFAWNMPPRYTVASLLPMMICAFAFAQHATDWLQRYLTTRARMNARTIALAPPVAIAVAVLIVDPIAASAAINSGYESNPDHKGAAEFMRTQNIVPEDVVIAEDVLQQTYYLGSVDYWLMSRTHARRYVERANGRIVDFYTHTPVISSAKMLEDLMRHERGHRIFVIGSGENQSDGRKGMRGDMDDVLRSDRFEVIYRGRDGLTEVWRAKDAAAPGAEPSPG